MASLRFLHVFSFFHLIINCHSLSTSSDVKLLVGKIKPSLQGTSESLLLSSWNSSVPVCQWRGVKWVFSDGSPLQCTALSSPPTQWTNLSLYNDSSLHLLSLQLPSANLTGSLPGELGEFSMLRSLFLNINALSGPLPLELGYASSLSDIDLSGNALTGAFPPSIWNLCENLVSLKLHGNSFSGALPEPALPNSTCGSLRVLDLGGNKLSGEFPEYVTKFKALKMLDLSSNVFQGSVPDGLGLLQLETLDLSHNNFSGMLPSFFGESKFGAESFQGNSPSLCGFPLKPCLGSSRLSPGAVAGLVIGLMSGAVVVASLLIGYLQNKKRKSSIESEDDLEEGDEEDEIDGSGGQGEGKLVVFQGGENLTLEEVLNATGQVMEKTNYGTVYKAKLSDGGNIALRLLREGTCKDRSSCLPVIKQRHKIALGIARGLAYLHTGQEAPIIHGNIRSKNVLVDDFFFARLTEFGLDKIMVQAVADEIVSQAKSDGYKAPELHKMKKCNPRSDVYAFGILLLEILMGKKPGKSGRNGGEYVDLPSLVKAAVLEETTMEVFDLEAMKGIRSPMEEGLVHALKLAMGCCAPVTTVRPSMEEVVKQLEENRPRNRSALRHKIALGIARGLAYLHTGQEAPIIHGNIRSKNVLVDDFFFARLTEFGLDKIMVQAVADEIVSQAKSDGYKAPELHKMKKCNPRSDVYAFGILLLEILMGKKPGKSGRNGGEYVDLPSLVKAAVLEETTMEVFDLEAMKGIRSPMEEGLVHALKLAMGCCAPVTTVRPSIEEVVKQLEENRPRNRSALYSPTETRSDAETPC
ncbi:hypothetical protein IGI04_012279 [Brassica rapa subsp. trilocularis]|uniref:Protein kinase domain-containing protein n=1 Tax=Brassica rapa subsp. trilocularis TaxID=1813537 RepID=A0ABQ7N5H9_BRACM|nr:hypothetical protein IGI04_012279 [Brassica rapa subsp. trilocularis]